MPKTKRKKDVTIKSNETKITFGILLALTGIAIMASPFMGEALVFQFVSQQLGYSALPWGFVVFYFSLRFLVDKDFAKSWKFLFGLILLSFVASTFLVFLIQPDVLIKTKTFTDSGGEIGYLIHTTLLDNIGDFLEFILISLVTIISLSLITGVKLEQIRGFFGSIFERIGEMMQNAKEKNELKRLEREREESGDEIKITKLGNSTSNKDLVFHDNSGGSSTNPNTKDNIKHEPKFIDNSAASTSSHSMTEKVAVTPVEKTEGENIFEEPKYPDWVYPSANLLKEAVYKPQNPEIHKKNAKIIEETLASFGVQSRVMSIATGPTVVQYSLSITIGTKVAKVKNLANDLALALAANSSSIRIEVPIPGTSLIGIEIPNPTPNFVYESEMISQLKSAKDKYNLPLILGKSVSGQSIIKDLTDLPHLLVAGATGTGKSVGINSMLTGLLMTKSPDELRIILVDPKMVEMAPYNGVPHLLTPVITDMELVINALQWSIEEMLRRYRVFKQVGVRKIKEYNQKMGYNALPYIIIIIDEMADLMLTTGVDVESKIVRLTQMSRAVGIHLILATQRPSVDVITGLIKANAPGRMAFSVSTSIDSRVVIDQTGAETLIGKGDMLFKSPEYPRPIRVQGAWTDTKDIENVVNFIKEQAKEVHYYSEITQPKPEEKTEKEDGNDFSTDTMFEDALDVVINAQKASASLLQRKLRIGYNRAARLIDELEEAGAIGGPDGSNPRKVLATSKNQILGREVQTEDQGILNQPTEIVDIYDDGNIEKEIKNGM